MVIVGNQQNLLDIAIQEGGSVAAVFSLAMQNDISITEKIKPGVMLKAEGLAGINGNVMDYIRKSPIKPATASSVKKGIGYYIIGTYFTVSPNTP